MMNKTEYEDTPNQLLLGLRFLACLFVLVGHMMLIAFSEKDIGHPSIQNFFKIPLYLSPWAGVWIFFGLSGYLMGKIFSTNRYTNSRSSILQFYRKRILRIYPIYLISLGLIIFLRDPLDIKIQNIETFIDLIIMDYSGQNGYNPIGSLWSISTEFKYYLLTPFLFYFTNKLTRKQTVVLLFSTVTLGMVIRFTLYKIFGFSDWYRYIYAPFISNFDFFYCGMLLSICLTKFKGKNFTDVRWLLIVPIFIAYLFSVVTGSMFMVFGKQNYLIPFVVINPTVVLICTLSFIYVAEKSIYLKSNFLIKFISKAGIYTYCAYVIHEPILKSFSNFFTHTGSLATSLAYTIITTLIIYLIAVFLYKFIESPIEKMCNPR